MVWEVVVMVWEEILGREMAMAWVVVMELEWEDLTGEKEALALKVWRFGLETGSAWSARMSTSPGATSATSVRNLKGMQCQSSKAVEGGAMGAKGGDLEVLQRPGLGTGIAQSRVFTFQKILFIKFSGVAT